ncbi:MAG TPA: type I methionyl aminopeptidase [Bacteroidales bacterium]|nr:type I methionyl aminopeptidase [Bacteroidales bacterium]HRZ49726.1 type I methionyl aminopeptidase [Bacteroidales bacterium]
MFERIQTKTDDQIELIRKSSLLVGKTLAEVAGWLVPGVETGKLDAIAETFIRDHGAIPGFKGYNRFPATLCISVNEQVVHGIPGKRTIKEGDIVSIDCGVILNGYYGDSAYTFAVGNVPQRVSELLEVTRQSLLLGIGAAVAGNRLGDIGYAIQSFVEGHGFSVVRELVGHGIGKKLHEKPEVMNYGKRGNGARLQEGLVICIEPMVNLGARHVVQDSDGWTIRTADRMPSAHFEHAVAIRKGKAEVLSTFSDIEEVWNKKNAQ